jgi:hypothetical protein
MIMKSRLVLALSGIILFAFLGCQKEYSYEKPVNGGGDSTVTKLGDTITATINGSSWAAQSIAAVDTAGELVIEGSLSNNTQSVALIMPFNISPGTYALDFSGGTFIGAYSPDPNTYLVSQNNGSITIIEDNISTRHIRGSFSFNASSLTGGTQTAQITNGYFSVNF